MGAFNGTGSFVRSYRWQTDAANGLNISSSRMDTEDDGFASGLSNCITRDGQSPWLANVPAGGFKITGLANGSAPSDSCAYGQLANYLPLEGGTMTGGFTLGGLTVSTAGTLSSVIGSGSTSPINGTSTLGLLPSASFTNSGGGGTVLGVTSSISSGGNNTNSCHFSGITQSVAIWYLYGNGTTSYTSDERTKQNILPARSGYLADLRRLHVVKFDRRAPDDIDLDNPGPRRTHGECDPQPCEIGLIAQDVAEVFPGLVVDAIHNLDGTTSPGTRSKVLKAEVIYGPIMLAALQELAAQVDELKAKLA